MTDNKQLIVGRNMDGEIDTFKVTVSHLVVFAIVPSNGYPYISVMWPGYVGTLSSVNSEGFYGMMNVGTNPSNLLISNNYPISWVMRQVMINSRYNSSPSDIQNIINKYAGVSGGACGTGCIFVFAKYNYNNSVTPAMVYEGNHLGGELRLPGEIQYPYENNNNIMASNHFLKFGVKDFEVGSYVQNWDEIVSASSFWRYTAGANCVENWASLGKKIGLAEMIRLLETVCHGATEHSIIVFPKPNNSSNVYIAVADMRVSSKMAWEGPFRDFKMFNFHEFFN